MAEQSSNKGDDIQHDERAQPLKHAHQIDVWQTRTEPSSVSQKLLPRDSQRVPGELEGKKTNSPRSGPSSVKCYSFLCPFVLPEEKKERERDTRGSRREAHNTCNQPVSRLANFLRKRVSHSWLPFFGTRIQTEVCKREFSLIQFEGERVGGGGQTIPGGPRG